MACRTHAPTGPSEAERLYAADPAAFERMVSDLSQDERRLLSADWRLWGRPKQVRPQGDWALWLLMGGRGSGKTRSGAEAIRSLAMERPRRISLLGPTAADVRDVMVEGESGILAVSPDWERPRYEPSKRRITWPNGSIGTCFSVEEPERLRGPQAHVSWLDEPAACDPARLARAWSNMILGARLGGREARPRVVATSTPKPTAWFFERVAEESTTLTVMTTAENAANLPEAWLAMVEGLYAGTDQGEQELKGALLGQASGALWRRAWLNAFRAQSAPDLARMTVAIDPSASDDESACEAGILAGGVDDRGELYVTEDLSMRASPAEWVAVAAAAAERLDAQIVYENNLANGMVMDLFRLVAPACVRRLKGVAAEGDKATRAQPVAAATQKGRVHLVGSHPALEQQLTTWTPGQKSPDRLDALVHLARALIMLTPPPRGNLSLATLRAPGPERRPFAVR